MILGLSLQFLGAKQFIEKILNIYTPFEFLCNDGRNLILILKDYEIYFRLQEGSFTGQEEK